MPSRPRTTAKRKGHALNYTSEEFVNKLVRRGFAVDLQMRNMLDELLIQELQKQQHTTDGISSRAPASHHHLQQAGDHRNSSVPTTTPPCHTPLFWNKWATKFREDGASTPLPPTQKDVVIFAAQLCARLCPLHAHNINYINLATVLTMLTTQQWTNFYRFCYLEWMQHADSHQSPWDLTPREFAARCNAAIHHPVCLQFLSDVVHVQPTRMATATPAATEPNAETPERTPNAEPAASARASDDTTTSQNHAPSDTDPVITTVRNLFFVNRLYQYLLPNT